MAFSKTITVASVGAPASYHVADNYNFHRGTQATSVMIASYADEDAFKAGKVPVGTWTNILINGYPPADQSAFAWADAQVVLAEPADGPVDTTSLPGSNTRYLLAGAEIVA